MYRFFKQQNSFTLVELLIVIGILAILTAAVVIVLNPAELLKQSRDSTRMSDLASLDNAIRTLQTQADISLGTAATVYISIPDTSSTCGNLGLPSLPSGYTYHCVATTTLQAINGSGWLPIDFTLSDIQSLSALPLDPTNTTSTGLYYTYIPGGSFELTTSLESSKYRLGGAQDRVSSDGGDTSYTYEKGTNLSLNPLSDTGLVGYWKFDEGTGTQAKDSSGNNNTGTLYNTPKWQTESNCKVGRCLSFDGVSEYVDAGNGSSFGIFGTGSFTVSHWIKRADTDTSVDQYTFTKGYPDTYVLYRGWYFRVEQGRYFGVNDSSIYKSKGLTIIDTNWHFLAGVVNRSTNLLSLYIDGILSGSSSDISTLGDITSGSNVRIGKSGADRPYKGLVDDARIYNRALSAAEVIAIYNATK